MEEIPGGSRPPKAANGIAAHVKQYLDFTKSQPFHKALVDIIKIEEFIQYQQKVKKNQPNTLQEKLRALRTAMDYIMHLLLPYKKKDSSDLYFKAQKVCIMRYDIYIHIFLQVQDELCRWGSGLNKHVKSRQSERSIINDRKVSD